MSAQPRLSEATVAPRMNDQHQNFVSFLSQMLFQVKRSRQRMETNEFQQHFIFEIDLTKLARQINQNKFESMTHNISNGTKRVLKSSAYNFNCSFKCS